MRKIDLRGQRGAGRFALVDDEDFALVASYKWCLWEYNGKGPYALTTIYRSETKKNTSLRMHSLITGWPLVDHQDHDGLNNQRCNLRPATSSQNMFNRKKQRGSSRFKGVCWHKAAGKWVAQIQCEGRHVHLGSFADEEVAARAYAEAAAELFGEYAYAGAAV